MADASKTIDLIFNGIDRTAEATQAALRNIGQIASASTGVVQPMGDLTTAAIKMEAGILAAGAAAVVFAAKVAGDFDSSFKQLTTIITDATDKDLAGFRESIKDFAANSGKDLGDVMGSLSAAVGSGVKWSESLDVVAKAEKLATATKADLKGTTEVLVSTMNAYGLETKDVGNLSDQLFTIIKDGKIEMNDLSQSLSMITPLAAGAGVPLKEVGAGIAALTAAGMQPGQAIEYLRGALSNIIKPSSEAEKLAKSLGIEFDANALKSKGLAGVLADVAKATGGSAEKMNILFGDVTGASAAMALTGPQAEAFTKSIGNLGNAAGATDEAYAKMAGSLDTQLGKVKSAFTGLMIEIGEPLLQKFGSLAGAIANVFLALAKSADDGALGDFVDYIGTQLDGIVAAAEAVAKNLPAALEDADLSGFKRGIETVTNAVVRLFGDVDLTSADGLENAIETVGAAFLGLSTYVAGAIDAFGPLFDALVDAADGAEGLDLGLVELAGNVGGIATQLNLLLPAMTGLVAVLTVKTAWPILDNLAALTPALGRVLPLLGQAGLVGAAGAAGYAVGTELAEGVDWLVSKLTGSENTLGGWIYDITHSGDAAEATAGKIALNTKALDANSAEAKATAGSTLSLKDDLKKLGEMAEDSGKKIGNTNPHEEMNNKLLAMADSATKLGGRLDASGKAVAIQSETILKTVPIIDAATGAIVGYEQQAVKVEKGSKDAAKGVSTISKEMDKAKKETEKTSLELQKLASNERIKLIEAAVKLNVAQVEADAQKVKAIFASIDNTVTSTGDLLGELFGTMKDWQSMGWTEKGLIEDQIELENERRGEALQLQKELTSAQIAEMRARTQSMQQGGGLIKIDGAGLQPHLEAFMWEILQAIQVRVNSDGMKMLLGV